MIVTVFTGNQPRHLALLKALAQCCTQVYAVVEVNTLFPGKQAGFYQQSPTMQAYFKHVLTAEKRIFGNVTLLPSHVSTVAVQHGDLSLLTLETLAPMLQSDAYVVFGASYIKGKLFELLSARNALNIHMGIAPYYRGSSCNFWAGLDSNYALIGATIHLLASTIDAGPVLFHALPSPTANIFDLGMMAVKSAQQGLVDMLKQPNPFTHFIPTEQDLGATLRYTRNVDFNDTVALQYLAQIPTSEKLIAALNQKELSKYIRPFVY